MEKLYRAIAEELFKRALFLVRGHKSQAEDLVQEVFKAAITGWVRESNPLGGMDYLAQRRWLYGVLYYKAIDSFRTTSREEHDFDFDQHPDPYDTERHALCSVVLDRALEVIKRMPRTRHLVVALRMLSDLPTWEVAGMLGIKETTVRGHLHDARQELSREIGPIFFAGDDEPGADLPHGGR